MGCRRMVQVLGAPQAAQPLSALVLDQPAQQGLQLAACVATIELSSRERLQAGSPWTLTSNWFFPPIPLASDCNVRPQLPTMLPRQAALAVTTAAAAAAAVPLVELPTMLTRQDTPAVTTAAAAVPLVELPTMLPRQATPAVTTAAAAAVVPLVKWRRSCTAGASGLWLQACAPSAAVAAPLMVCGGKSTPRAGALRLQACVSAGGRRGEALLGGGRWKKVGGTAAMLVWGERRRATGDQAVILLWSGAR